MPRGKLQKNSQRDLRAGHRDWEEQEAGGVHVESERGGEKKNRGQIAKKNSAKRNGKGNNIGVVAAIEKKERPSAIRRRRR